MKSLYAQYVLEREGKEVVETEEAFASYSFHDDGKVCYIQEIFVVPEKRQSGVAAALADQIAEIAKSRGATMLVGSVDPRANGAERSATVLEKYGMKPLATRGNLVFYGKGI